jgi:RimJ/RimL family protein N-acetyltransferase
LPELRTERLVLREWNDDDLEPFAALNSDPQVMEHLPAPLSREQSDEMVGRLYARAAQGRPSLWAVEVPGIAPFIGFIGLLEPAFDAHFTPCVEVGWRLAKEHWGRGYAPEGARAALAWAFEEGGLDEVVSFTVPHNTSSRRVMEKLGMRRDPAEDFDHPHLPIGHPLRRHVLYRLRRAEHAAATPFDAEATQR